MTDGFTISAAHREAMKMDFVPYIERLFPAMLMGINGEKEQSWTKIQQLSMVSSSGSEKLLQPLQLTTTPTC